MATGYYIYLHSSHAHILTQNPSAMRGLSCGKTVANIYESAGTWYDLGKKSGGVFMEQMIYVADDEKNIRDLIGAFLTKENFQVKTFENGDSLMTACNSKMPDLVILDIMMPGTDGLSICSLLRKTNADLPIIIVSAKDSPYDRVTGLTLGSDDYLIKPFLPLELVARVRSLLRRTQKNVSTAEPIHTLVFGTLQLYPERRDAILDDKPLTLTPTEFDFLAYLVEHQERAVSRDELLQALWQVNWQADTRVTDDLVKRLRRKLRDQKSSVQVETVWGFGFRISAEGGHL